MAQTLNILSLDLSSPVIKAAVVAVNGNNLQILEKHETTTKYPIFRSSTAAAGEAADQFAPTATETLAVELNKILKEVKTPWRSAVVSIPYEQGLSINLSLPFKDPRQIQKVLPLEVQDMIPFEVDDFHLATTLDVAANEDEVGCDVRVDLAKKETLKSLLSSLDEVGVDPRVISFPTGALATLLDVAPNYFANNCAILNSCDSGTTILVVVGGAPRAARNLPVPKNEAECAEILKEARLFLGHAERRYDVSLEKVYLIGGVFNPFQVKEILGHEFEFLNIHEFIKTYKNNEDSDICPLLAYQASIPHFLTQANFRTGEFQFRPKMKELVAGLKTIIPYGVFFVACLFTTVAGTYLANISKIEGLESAVKERIQKTIPNLSTIPGQELSAITAKISEIESQLKELGSLAALSPLEAFLVISEDLPDNLGVVINELSIKETKLSIKGTVPDYGTLDKIEKALKEKSSRYCEVSAAESSGSSGKENTVGFQLNLTLC
jgi:hypothetical protein